MKPQITACAVALVLSMIGAVPATAGTSGAVYDMNGFLNQRHPFDTQQAPAAAPVTTPTMPVSPLRPAPRRQAQSVPAKAPAPTAPALRKTSRPEPPTAQKRDSGWGPGNFVSEIRGGVLAHDQGPFSSNKEDGVDLNLEVLFNSPGFLDLILSPRPHAGITGNTSGDTSQFYIGLGWEWTFFENWFAGLTLGGAAHEGELSTSDGARDKKELGCRILFRGSVDLGYRFRGPHSVMAHFSHISNAKLCDQNDGLENIGLRYGYRF